MSVTETTKAVLRALFGNAVPLIGLGVAVIVECGLDRTFVLLRLQACVERLNWRRRVSPRAARLQLVRLGMHRTLIRAKSRPRTSMDVPRPKP